MEPLFYSQLVRSTGNNLELQLASGVQRKHCWNPQFIAGQSEAQMTTLLATGLCSGV